MLDWRIAIVLSRSLAMSRYLVVLQPTGSYGFTANSPGASTDAQCPPIPPDSPLYGTKLQPIALSAVRRGVTPCLPVPSLVHAAHAQYC
jgi:hypothetical protein